MQRKQISKTFLSPHIIFIWKLSKDGDKCQIISKVSIINRGDFELHVGKKLIIILIISIIIVIAIGGVCKHYEKK